MLSTYCPHAVHAQHALHAVYAVHSSHPRVGPHLASWQQPWGAVIRLVGLAAVVGAVGAAVAVRGVRQGGGVGLGEVRVVGGEI